MIGPYPNGPFLAFDNTGDDIVIEGMSRSTGAEFNRLSLFVGIEMETFGVVALKKPDIVVRVDKDFVKIV